MSEIQGWFPVVLQWLMVQNMKKGGSDETDRLAETAKHVEYDRDDSWMGWSKPNCGPGGDCL